MRKLLDRYRQYKLIDDSELAREGIKIDLDSLNENKNNIFFAIVSDGVFTPNFVELTTTDINENLQKLKESNVHFPFGELMIIEIHVQFTICQNMISYFSMQTVVGSWFYICS